MTTRKQLDEAMQEACERFRHDPLGFVRFFFDWGHGELKDEAGPDEWQAAVLNEIGSYSRKNIKAAAGVGADPGPFQHAVASGHGIGKSALVSWIILWFMSCRPDANIRVTANTETQLNTTTWRELAVWHSRVHTKDWFTWTATKFYSNEAPNKWYATAVAWSENNPDAFAGVHAENTLIIFDEASNISDVIWEKADGAMSTFGAMWCVFGNPTRNVGRFYDCFHKDRKFWITRQIDSRQAKKANKKWIEDFIARRGLNDDRTKYQILGQFPSASTRQLIPTDAVEKCMNHEADPESYQYLPKVMGVDVARFGENNSVICLRQGRKVFPMEVLPKQDLMATAQWVAEAIKRERPIQVFVDGSGIGAGVVDRLRNLNFQIVEVNGGNQSLSARFLNKRAEMWSELKEFIVGLCELPRDQTLKDELTVVEYSTTDRGRIRLDRKEDIMDDHGFSPDRADALAMTFAYPIADDSESGVEYDPPVFQD